MSFAPNVPPLGDISDYHQQLLQLKQQITYTLSHIEYDEEVVRESVSPPPDYARDLLTISFNN